MLTAASEMPLFEFTITNHAAIGNKMEVLATVSSFMPQQPETAPHAGVGLTSN